MRADETIMMLKGYITSYERFNDLSKVTPQLIETLKSSLELIDEYQKGIKELKVLLNSKKEINYIKTIDINPSYYISEDKIREKIEHYNNELEHIKNGEEFENERPMYYWGKVALENLLEEN